MRMHAARVSVIIPVYNGVRFVAEAVTSVLSQTHQDVEVVIVNDGSPDTSKDVIQPLLRDPRVKYHEQANGGVANARNTGIRLAAGKYIAFLDQDDLWHPTKLAQQVDYMEKHPEVALVHSDITFIDAEGQPLPTPEWAWVRGVSGNCLDELVAGNRIATLTALVRRNHLDEAGLFRQELAPADDWDMWLRLAARHPFGFIPEKLGCYRLHGSNESRAYLKMQMAETAVIERFSEEHGRLPGVRRGTLRHKRLALYKQTANLALREGRDDLSQRYWVKALALQPWDLGIYGGLAWNALGAERRRALQWYRRKLSSKVEVND